MPGHSENSPIEIRSEEVRDILGQIPSWIVRWGMVLLFLLIALLLFGSWVFKYPYIITSDIRITTENPPYNAIARTNGRIVRLFVEDNQNVKEGEILALIENPADYQDIMLLKTYLDSFRTHILRINPDSSIIFTLNIQLGEIQQSYSAFLKYYEDLKNFIRLDYHDQKISSLESEIDRYEAHSWTLKKQSRILEGERKLMQNQFTRDSLLYVQGVIPEADYEKSKSNLLQKQRAYEESRSIIVNNQIETARLEQQILDLKLQKSENRDRLHLNVMEYYENLNAKIADWEQNYVLRSAADGVVSFTNIRNENQNIREGERVMSVIPGDSGEIIGKAQLNVAGSGKVAEGQTVNVKLANFPYLEYGTVKGVIRSISLVTEGDAYSAIVEFPGGLETTYGNSINFSQDMQGQAEIITNDERLLERIANPVKSVISRQKAMKSSK